MSIDIKKDPFGLQLINQLRALDAYGHWGKYSDEELLIKTYVKTKEELKEIPLMADIDETKIKEIRLIYQALALAFEVKTGVMCNVIMEMSHEGFGRCAVIADKVVIVDKYFKDAHRFSFRTFEKLFQECTSTFNKALEIYEQYKPCSKG